MNVLVAIFDLTWTVTGACIMESVRTRSGVEYRIVTDQQPEHGWCCFHCGDIFTTYEEAYMHFGLRPTSPPACRLDRGVLIDLRAAENRVVELEDRVAELEEALGELLRSAGPVILYDAHRLLAALDIGVKGVAFPTSTFRRLPAGPPNPHERNETPTGTTKAPTKGNPFPHSTSPRGDDKATVTAGFPLPAQESSQPQSLFDCLRYWAYAHVADAGDAESWQEAVQRQAVVMAASVPDPENYTPARIATTARSVSAWTWERRDAFTGGRRDVDAATQAWRARRRAEAVWETNAGRDAEIVRLSLAGYSQRVIARSVGVSPMTVNRVLNRLEEAEDGAPELRMDAIEPAPNNQEVSDATTREPFSDGGGPRPTPVDGAGWTEGMADTVPWVPRGDSAARASAEAAPPGGLQVRELRSPRGGGLKQIARSGWPPAPGPPG